MSDQRDNRSRSGSNGQTSLLVMLLTLVMLVGLVGLVEARGRGDGSESPTVKVLQQAVVPGGVNTIIQIPVAKDSYISSARPSTNFGTLTTTKIGYEADGDGAMRILLQFNLNSIPDNVRINSAQFQYYLLDSRPTFDAPMGFKAQFMKAPWGEYTVTWNNASYLGGSALTIGEVPSSVGWHVSEATAAVQTWYSGEQPNYGVLITGDEGAERNRSRVFYSRERSAFSPSLIVDYTVSCDSLPPVVTVDSLPSHSPGSFKVEWSGTDTAPSGCEPSGIAYYDVQYRVNGGSWVAWQTQTTNTSATIESAANGRLYEFRARAVDNAGNAQPFGIVQASTRIDTVAPVAEVVDMDAYTFSSFFLVQWIGSDNLSGIASYDVQWRTSNGNWQTLITNTPDTSFQFTGGQNRTTYEFRARARDEVGNVQPFSDEAQTETTVFTHADATVLPFEPLILKPTAAVTETFSVEWSFDAGPTTPKETRIYYRYDHGQWTLWDIFPYPTLSADFPWDGLGFGDGIFEFEAVAINTINQIEPRQMRSEAAIWVDMADVVQRRSFLPLIQR